VPATPSAFSGAMLTRFTCFVSAVCVHAG
jgi:hypothetical protein